ncbi:MAG: UDP-N-acetylmuramate--L-alanine ligase [Candidatus Wildermuthbacteria bacterium]|nr:UDP-N-acetylmuramate--L-alanine ligase [Candidatus Wildermuthbacteria bacterium]
MRIHFIGIGGIGVSALAKYYLKKGWEVSGCDLAQSEITDQLKEMGAHIRIGKPEKNCVPANTERIVYSPAVSKENLRIENCLPAGDVPKGQKLKVPALSYPETLGELTKTHYTIAVSGTHGKSTTTSMIGLLLVKAGFDPTIIVGTKLKELGDSNCRVGRGKYLVIEADEHFASFLNYWPTIIVLTTVEADHLDYYKNLENIIETFKKYVKHLPEDGWLVANKDDKNISEIRSVADSSQTMLFSLKQREAEEIRKLMKIPGEHNVANALAALSVARILKIPDVISMKALGEYRGSWRRFEVFNLKKPKPYTLVSDYGHHPTEIKVTVEAAKQKWPNKPIWLVFQPHQYQRTYLLWDDFVKVLSNLPVEKLILTDIYDVAGREDKKLKAKVSSEKLVTAIENCKLKIKNYPIIHIPTVQQAEQYIKKNVTGGEIVMVMGAGDIYNLTLSLTKSKIK